MTLRSWELQCSQPRHTPFGHWEQTKARICHSQGTVIKLLCRITPKGQLMQVHQTKAMSCSTTTPWQLNNSVGLCTRRELNNTYICLSRTPNSETPQIWWPKVHNHNNWIQHRWYEHGIEKTLKKTLSTCKIKGNKDAILTDQFCRVYH